MVSTMCAAFGPVRCQKRIGGPSSGAVGRCLIIGGNPTENPCGFLLTDEIVSLTSAATFRRSEGPGSFIYALLAAIEAAPDDPGQPQSDTSRQGRRGKRKEDRFELPRSLPLDGEFGVGELGSGDRPVPERDASGPCFGLVAGMSHAADDTDGHGQGSGGHHATHPASRMRRFSHDRQTGMPIEAHLSHLLLHRANRSLGSVKPL